MKLTQDGHTLTHAEHSNMLLGQAIADWSPTQLQPTLTHTPIAIIVVVNFNVLLINLNHSRSIMTVQCFNWH